MSHSSENNKRVQKREQFAQTPPKNHANFVIGSAAAVLVGLVLVMAFSGRNASSASTVVSATVSPDGNIRIPVTGLDNGQANFFEYRASNNKTVRFFAIKSSDGVYRAAADACDVCYRQKMGYYQQGDDMVCRKCGRHFPSAYVNEVTGGCNPDGIPQTLQGGSMIINAAELEARTALF